MGPGGFGQKEISPSYARNVLILVSLDRQREKPRLLHPKSSNNSVCFLFFSSTLKMGYLILFVRFLIFFSNIFFQLIYSPSQKWCGRSDSNRQASRRKILSLPSLPISPRPRIICIGYFYVFVNVLIIIFYPKFGVYIEDP